MAETYFSESELNEIKTLIAKGLTIREIYDILVKDGLDPKVVKSYANLNSILFKKGITKSKLLSCCAMFFEACDLF